MHCLRSLRKLRVIFNLGLHRTAAVDTFSIRQRHSCAGTSSKMFMLAADDDVTEEELAEVAKKIERKLKKLNMQKSENSKRMSTECINVGDIPSKRKKGLIENGGKCISLDIIANERNINGLELNGLDFVSGTSGVSKVESARTSSIAKKRRCKRKKHVTVKIDGKRKKLTSRLKRILDQQEMEREEKRSQEIKSLNKWLYYGGNFNGTTRLVRGFYLCHKCDKPRLNEKPFMRQFTGILNSIQKLKPTFSVCEKVGCCYYYSTNSPPGDQDGRRTDVSDNKETEDDHMNERCKHVTYILQQKAKSKNQDNGMSLDDSGCVEDEDKVQSSDATAEEFSLPKKKIDICTCSNEVQQENLESKGKFLKSKLMSGTEELRDEQMNDANLENAEHADLPDQNDELEERLHNPKSDFHDIDAMLPPLESYVAIDCEFVGVEPVNANGLGRVSIVDFNGHVVYDTYCKPDAPIMDYRTKWSGIQRDDMKNSIPVEIAQQRVRAIVQDKIVIGHGLANDLKVLDLDIKPSNIRDTVAYKRLHRLALRQGGSTPSLKNFCNALLGRRVQQGSHCSVQDARMCMELFKLVRVGWERKIILRHLGWKKQTLERDIEGESEPVDMDNLLKKATEESLFDDKFWPDDMDNK